jgi:hypothetical protein
LNAVSLIQNLCDCSSKFPARRIDAQPVGVAEQFRAGRLNLDECKIVRQRVRHDEVCDLLPLSGEPTAADRDLLVKNDNWKSEGETQNERIVDEEPLPSCLIATFSDQLSDACYELLEIYQFNLPMELQQDIGMPLRQLCAIAGDDLDRRNLILVRKFALRTGSQYLIDSPFVLEPLALWIARRI